MIPLEMCLGKIEWPSVLTTDTDVAGIQCLCSKSTPHTRLHDNGNDSDGMLSSVKNDNIRPCL